MDGADPVVSKSSCITGGGLTSFLFSCQTYRSPPASPFSHNKPYVALPFLASTWSIHCLPIHDTKAHEEKVVLPTDIPSTGGGKADG